MNSQGKELKTTIESMKKFDNIIIDLREKTILSELDKLKIRVDSNYSEFHYDENSNEEFLKDRKDKDKKFMNK